MSDRKETFKPNVGDRIGMLVIVARAGSMGSRRAWAFRCDCGTEGTADTKSLWKRRAPANCGCLSRTKMGRKKHGMSHAPEYAAWDAMHGRCTNQNYANYGNYGGRGITVCDRWHSFEAFYADMGARPSPEHSLDRIDNNGNYEPGNCRWATASEQYYNRRTTKRYEWEGRQMTVIELAAVCGMSHKLLSRRLRRGMTPIQAMTKKLRTDAKP